MTRKAKTEEQKKFEFTGETKVEFGVTFRRIRALITIAGVVTAGDLGGWLQHENNLSQVSDKAWVFGDAQVSDKAWVFGEAQVSGEAQVFDKARVFGEAQVSDKAWVFGKARVFGEAQVSDKAWVFGDAQVSNKARVFGEAQVFGEARVSPIFISGLPWSVTISDQQMVVGCQHHTIAEWYAFDDRAIAAMDGASASRFWRDFKEPLFALIKATGRPFAQVNTADAESEPAQSEAAE